jgi:oxygen-independent coproporphyrinogen-3 oxidase
MSDPPVTVGADWQAGGFGLYIHWPFCLAKCPYCDFNSHVSRTVDHAAWRKALVAEMRHMRELTGPRALDTVFFGGGTPSLMEPATVAALIDEAGRLWGLAGGAEITLEANPTSVEAGKFGDYAAAGVNRLSLGVQALDDADLKALGRMHSVAEAEAAFDIARAAFTRVSFDLIYARMGQTVAAWEAELARAMTMAAMGAVDHFSLYQLTIEPGTRFGELYDLGKLKVPEDEGAACLRGLEPCQAGSAEPAQPGLLALWRLCRHRSGGAWAVDAAEWAADGDGHRPCARGLAGGSGREGSRGGGENPRCPGRPGHRIHADGDALGRGGRSGPLPAAGGGARRCGADRRAGRRRAGASHG